MEGEATNKWHRTISSPVEFLSGVRLFVFSHFEPMQLTRGLVEPV